MRPGGRCPGAFPGRRGRSPPCSCSRSARPPAASSRSTWPTCSRGRTSCDGPAGTMATTTLKASSVDIPALVGLMREFYAEAGRALDDDWAAASFSALLGDPSRGAAWIVKVDSVPAGHAVLTFRHSMEFGGLDAFVDDLFVRPGHRRRGLGRALLAALFDECRRRGVLAVHVE